MHLKSGMGGSNGGKGRREGTEELKAKSSKPRRRQGRRSVMDEVAENMGLKKVKGALGGTYYE